MNARIIKNYNPDMLTDEFLHTSSDWDLIELDVNLDIEKLTEWYNETSKEFDYLRFDFDTSPNKLDVALSKEMVKEGFCGYMCGPISGITFAWPIERDEPLPPPVQANPEQFPEVNYNTFRDDAKIMQKFRKGYLLEMLELLGEDSFRQMVMVTHHPGMQILQHVDTRNLKVHIPVETHENSFFHFGKDRELGKYHLQLGKVYILNTGVWHGTSNEGDKDRTHIITRIIPEQLQTILRLKN